MMICIHDTFTQTFSELRSSTIGFSFAGTCFSAISFKRTDRSERNFAEGVSAFDLSFCNILLKQKKNQSFRVLPLARNVKHGAGSVQRMQFPRKCYGCQPWLGLRSVIHSSAHPPCQTGALVSPGGVHIRMGGLLRHVSLFNIKSQWQDRDIFIFCYE